MQAAFLNAELLSFQIHPAKYGFGLVLLLYVECTEVYTVQLYFIQQYKYLIRTTNHQIL